MKKCIKSISILNELTLSATDTGEIDRYAESGIFWAASKKKPIQKRLVKKGKSINLSSAKILCLRCLMNTEDLLSAFLENYCMFFLSAPIMSDFRTTRMRYIPTITQKALVIIFC